MSGVTLMSERLNAFCRVCATPARLSKGRKRVTKRRNVESASKSRVWETTIDAHERGKNFLNDIEAEKLLEAAKRG